MRLLFLFFLWIASFAALAQTTLNAYAKVTSVTGSSVLALSNVNIANHTFTVGGQVVVMQMQDNVIGTNTTNASTFGNLSSIANAGKYEIRTIAGQYESFLHKVVGQSVKESDLLSATNDA